MDKELLTETSDCDVTVGAIWYAVAGIHSALRNVSNRRIGTSDVIKVTEVLVNSI